jgi:putative spermidine/putrescine transport system ATP-binding protein
MLDAPYPARQGATQSGMGHAVTLTGITHRYGSFVAVRDVSLEVSGGSLVAFLGPSGCGKSTLLRAIAGFIRPQAGSIAIGGQVVDNVRPNRRGVGIVFQNYALFPHLTVTENVAYGPQAQGVGRAEVRHLVEENLRLVQMADYANRLPRELSGGQQQRVALARVLAARPRILLLDEPFGALDKNLRFDMQIEIKRLQRELNLTTILVTHDQEEAMSMAERIVVVNQGRIEQVGTPSDVYDRPATLFAGTFVGSTNLLPGRIAAIDGTTTRVRLVAGGEVDAVARAPLGVGGRVLLSVRPERMRLVNGPGPSRIAAKLDVTMPLGPTVVHEVILADGLRAKVSEPRVNEDMLRGPGDEVHVELRLESGAAIFPDGLVDEPEQESLA